MGGTITCGLFTAVTDTFGTLDRYSPKCDKYGQDILSSTAQTSFEFVCNFVKGIGYGAVISTTFPFLGPMYLYHKYNKKD